MCDSAKSFLGSLGQEAHHPSSSQVHQHRAAGGIVLQQIGVIFVQEGVINTPALPKFTSGIPLQLVKSDNSSFVLIVLEQGFSTQ